MASPRLQSIVVVDIPVMAHRQIPMVVEILQLQSIDQVLDVLLRRSSSSRVQAVRNRFALVFLPGPGRSHARCVQRQMPMVDVLMQFIDLGGRCCDAAAISSSCRPQQLE